MDFASFRTQMELKGFQKVSTTSMFMDFKTTFIKHNNIVEVNWQMGGYINNIIFNELDSSKTVYNSPKKFIETLTS